MSIEDNAFSNTTIESLILYQNNVVTMSSRAFEKSTDRSSSCVDFEAWSMNDTLLNRSFTCENFASKSYFSYRQSLTTPGSCGYNYLRACCSGGGGHVYGRNIGMDFHSSVTCRVVDGDDGAKAAGGVLTEQNLLVITETFGGKYRHFQISLDRPDYDLYLIGNSLNFN